MSNVALCIVSEYIGRTVADIPHLMINSSFYNKVFTNVFSNIGHFRKYMFEIIYSLYCMNSKCGVIHGDLHLNNATMQPRFSDDIGVTSKNMYILYILDSKSIDITEYSKIYNKTSNKPIYKTIDMQNTQNKLQFIFPHEFMHMSLIDFNR